MKFNLSAGILLLTMLVHCQLPAQDTSSIHGKKAVITSTKFEQTSKETGRFITVLDETALRKHSGRSLPEILNTIPGLHFDGSYLNPGANISYYLNGARNGQILVLIDGIPVNDAADISNSFDFRYLPVEQVEKIEVLQGGMSSLYGTDAIAGVISITTKNAESGKVNFHGDATYGTYNTFNTHLGVNGWATDKLWYVAGFDYLATQGFSSAADSNSGEVVDSTFVNPLRTPFDKDGFSRTNAMAKLGYKFSGHFKIEGHLRADSYDADIDNGEFNDDENRKFKSAQLVTGLHPTYSYKNGKISLNAIYYQTERNDLNDSSEYVGATPIFSYLNGYTNTTFRGTSIRADLVHEHEWSQYITTLAGLYAQQNSYYSDETAYGDFLGSRPGQPVGRIELKGDSLDIHSVDPYFAFLLNNRRGFTLSTGVRASIHETYGSNSVYHFNPAFLFPAGDFLSLKLYFNASTSFKAPTLYQLYSIFGNSELQPEEAASYLLGIAGYFHKNLKVNTSVYQRDETNSILFGPAGYYNGGSRIIRGVNAEVEWSIDNAMEVRYHLARVFSEEDADLYRIPKTTFGVNLVWHPKEAMDVGVSFLHVGDRQIFDYTISSPVPLPDYALIDLYAAYRLLDGRVEIFASVNNILGEDYIDVYGFNTKYRTLQGGLRVNLPE